MKESAKFRILYCEATDESSTILNPDSVIVTEPPYHIIFDLPN